MSLAGLSLILLTPGACEPASILPSSTGQVPSCSITLALLGDVMLGRWVRPTPDTFRYLRPYLETADLVLANLESPLTGQPVQTTSPYSLCAPTVNAKLLAGAGFDLLSLANNHILDCGAEGLAETQSTLTGAGLGFIGPGSAPAFREVNGIRLAFLAFDATSGLDLEGAGASVRSARETEALVVVSIHWGGEYQSGESKYQRQIASRLAEAGAALIWGHHPHVLQPARWMDGGRALVLYSLGNALFDQYGLESTRRSALALVRLDQHGVRDLEVIPFVIDVRRSRIVEADKESRRAVLKYFK